MRLLSILLFLLTACTSPAKIKQPLKAEIQEKASPKPEPFEPPIDFDPYFNPVSVVTSLYAPPVITRNILQDKKGMIWLATWNGIISYNGHIFKNHTILDTLRKHRMFTILEDSKDNIWFGSIGAGLYRYDGSIFTNFTKEDGMADDKIECLMEDRVGNIWFGSDAGITCYDGKTFKNYTPEGGALGADVHSIIEDKFGKLWVASEKGVCYFDGETFTAFSDEKGRPFNNVRHILEDKQGNLWFAGQYGLYRYNGKVITTIMEEFAGYLFEDSKGAIWISGVGNEFDIEHILYRYNTTQFETPKEALEKVKTSDAMLFGITEADDGSIWVGTLRGAFRYDGMSFEYFKE